MCHTLNWALSRLLLDSCPCISVLAPLGPQLCEQAVCGDSEWSPPFWTIHSAVRVLLPDSALRTAGCRLPIVQARSFTCVTSQLSPTLVRRVLLDQVSGSCELPLGRGARVFGPPPSGLRPEPPCGAPAGGRCAEPRWGGPGFRSRRSGRAHSVPTPRFFTWDHAFRLWLASLQLGFFFCEDLS